jgi:hypothetical protein
VYYDDHKEIRACEANPDPRSAVGLYPELDAEITGYDAILETLSV